jgi:hypothetical protein
LGQSSLFVNRPSQPAKLVLFLMSGRAKLCAFSNVLSRSVC